MTVQSSTNLTNTSFVLRGNARIRNGQTLKQDAGRSGALAQYTLLAYDPTNAKWVPFTDETATDGTQTPMGISFSSATEAAIKAGDVLDFYVYVGGDFDFDQAKLVIENSKTLATIIAVPTNQKITVQQWLKLNGMHPVSVLAADAYEN